ncbi:MAG: amino acid ABC transporter permease [Lachnospiraceae bacterium]|nr:amino acid ABC transporter permease [Lachnospiraceae bacterium]
MKLNTKFMIKTFLDALAGVPVTLQLTLVTLMISSLLGFFMALGKIENRKVSGKLISAYVSFIRGTPVVLQILFLYSLLPTMLNYFIKEVLGLSFNIFLVNPIIYAYLVFVLNTTAVLSEVFRSALLTVGQGQMEAALTIGMTKTQAYVRIIIPQAIVSALPNICNATISLLKSTSLAFMMSVQDVTAIAKVKAAYGYNYIEAYLDICLIYIILCTVIQLVFKAIEKHASSYKRAIAG